MTLVIFFFKGVSSPKKCKIHSNMTAYVIGYNGGNGSKASMVVLLMIYCNSLVIQT